MRQVQTALAENVLRELKERSGADTTRDAIAKAIHHYLACPNTNEDHLDKRLEDAVRRKNKQKSRASNE